MPTATPAARCSVFASLLLLFAAIAAPANAQSTHVELKLSVANGAALQDTIFIELFDDRPITTTNFLQYVDAGLYDNVLFHRLVQGFVLQGGGFQNITQPEPAPLDWSIDTSQVVDLDGNPNTSNPQILNEFDGTRSNIRGTLAMAKVGGNPNSATNQWFINLANNGPNLDSQNGGFTTFAEVVGNGMDLIDFIARHRTSNFNPDVNDDGIIDGGALTDTPFRIDANAEFELFSVARARQTDYWGDGSVTNVPASNIFLSENTFIDTGAQVSGEGRLSINAGVELGIVGGQSIGNRINNFGVLTLGNQIGAVTATRYSQFDSGVLEIQLAGTTAGTEHDQLIVTGGDFPIAVLDGLLDVKLLDGFEPSLGDEFVVLSADLIQANFAEFELPELRDSLVWDVQKTNTAITLAVGGGDYDGDGAITGADYLVWRSNFGQAASVAAGGDGNFDGVVNAADYTIWRDAFDAALGAGAAETFVAQTPEPASLGLLAMTGLAGFVARRKRR